MTRPRDYDTEQTDFYAGAKHSDNLQSKLDVMQAWTAKRLAAAVPAWAKPKFLPGPFKPQLSQRFSMHGNTSCKCTRTVEQFRGLYEDMTVNEYVSTWNERNNLKPVASEFTTADQRMAA